jgi:dTDP-glucose 4,6-dehydratase
VVIVDKLTYAGNLRTIHDILENPRVRFVKGDIADRQSMTRIFAESRPSAIVNFAAESHVDRSIDGPRNFVHSNIQGTFELLECSRRFLRDLDPGARASFRFLQISTDEVFGTLGLQGAFSETTPYAPRSPYSATKASADHLVRAYYATYGLPTLITNCSNNYGPYQYPEKLIPLVTLNALSGRELPVYGDGRNVRDWLHVRDHCEAVALVLARGEPGETYNVGARNERENLEVVRGICDALEEILPAAENPRMKGSGVAEYRGLIRFQPDRPGHDFRYAIDPSKIERELGWKARSSFTQGLKETVKWYVENLDWCTEVQATAYGGERLGLSSAPDATPQSAIPKGRSR